MAKHGGELRLRLREVITSGGFTRFHRGTETLLSLVLEASRD
jgi:hypothetical protein